MCLFDVVVSLDFLKTWKKRIFLYFFFKFAHIFSDIFPYIADKLYSRPLAREQAKCNIDLKYNYYKKDKSLDTSSSIWLSCHDRVTVLSKSPKTCTWPWPPICLWGIEHWWVAWHSIILTRHCLHCWTTPLTNELLWDVSGH